MRDADDVTAALARSKFRSRFELAAYEQAYLDRKGLELVLQHGRDIISERVATAEPKNDGRQTPLRGHPIFIAQHATATCCRGCLAKWHDIAKAKPLSADEIDYVLGVLRQWLKVRVKSTAVPGVQLDLFPRS